MPRIKKTRKRYAPKRSPQEQRRRRLARRRALFSILVILIVSALVFFLVLRNSGEISIAENGVGSVFSRLQLGFTNISRSVQNFFQRWHNYDDLSNRYQALNQENQRLTLQLNSAQEAIQENERLNSLLGARSSYETLDPIFAKVIGRDPSPWFYTFTIDRGTGDGVATGMSVVNGDGLVGRIYEAGLNYAKVICIIDPRSAVACMIQSTRDNGIMRGEVMDDDDEARCYVYYLPNLNSIMPGDDIITSGTDSLFPKGLHIGTVSAVSLDAGSEGTYAVIQPAVDFQRIEEVFVLRYVVREESDNPLPVVATPTRSTVSTPNPNTTPTPTPTPAEPNWGWPTASATAGTIEILPEDEWAR